MEIKDIPQERMSERFGTELMDSLWLVVLLTIWVFKQRSDFCCVAVREGVH